MKFHVEIFETATDDLQDSYNWYEERSIGLGEQFIDEVDEYLDLISNNPYQFSVQFSEKYRFALLKRFPFRIVYNIAEDENLVNVTAVFHTSRDPGRF
jgi:plasmid stabilization system protein ParE